MMTPDDLLDCVTDRDSFIAFVRALAAERYEAAQIERENPSQYIVDGALGWKNGDIDNFLDAALQIFTAGPLRQPDLAPSWKTFADFLYFGKIYE